MLPTLPDGMTYTLLLFGGTLYSVVGLLIQAAIRFIGIPVPHDRERCTTCSPVVCSVHRERQPCRQCVNQVTICPNLYIGRHPLMLKEWLGGAVAWPVTVACAVIAVVGYYVFKGLGIALERLDRVMSIKV